MLLRVLIALDSPAAEERVARLLAAQEAHVAIGAGDILRLFDREEHTLVLAGPQRLGGGGAADAAVRALRALSCRPEVVVLGAEADGAASARLLASGCLAVVQEDLPQAQLGATLAALLRRVEEGRDLLASSSASQANPLPDLHSSSAAMRPLLERVRRVAPTAMPVLIEGETGTGKEWLAHAIHAAGPRAAGPFVPVHCAGLPDALVESELFGHERGAFTGAERARRGSFELAHHGTVLLDEIGDMPLGVQVKLLRVLEDHRIQRLGGEELVPLNVRVIAATHRDLAVEVARGRFREDLYYRLAVVRLALPPLRDRPEDIPEIVERSLPALCAQAHRPPARLSREAMDALLGYRWPGNVRELLNCLANAALVSSGPVVTAADLPDLVHRRRDPEPVVTPCAAAAADAVEPASIAEGSLEQRCMRVYEACERQRLVAALRASGGRVGEAAARTRMSRRSVSNKLRKYGLRPADFRFAAPPDATRPPHARSRRSSPAFAGQRGPAGASEARSRH